MYEVSDKRNLAEKPVKGLAPVERFLERLLREWEAGCRGLHVHGVSLHAGFPGGPARGTRCRT